MSHRTPPNADVVAFDSATEEDPTPGIGAGTIVQEDFVGGVDNDGVPQVDFKSILKHWMELTPQNRGKSIKQRLAGDNDRWEKFKCLVNWADESHPRKSYLTGNGYWHATEMMQGCPPANSKGAYKEDGVYSQALADTVDNPDEPEDTRVSIPLGLSYVPDDHLGECIDLLADSSIICNGIPGCVDIAACNFKPTATENDPEDPCIIQPSWLPVEVTDLCEDGNKCRGVRVSVVCDMWSDGGDFEEGNPGYEWEWQTAEGLKKYTFAVQSTHGISKIRLDFWGGCMLSEQAMAGGTPMPHHCDTDEDWVGTGGCSGDEWGYNCGEGSEYSGNACFRRDLYSTNNWTVERSSDGGITSTTVTDDGCDISRVVCGTSFASDGAWLDTDCDGDPNYLLPGCPGIPHIEITSPNASSNIPASGDGDPVKFITIWFRSSYFTSDHQWLTHIKVTAEDIDGAEYLEDDKYYYPEYSGNFPNQLPASEFDSEGNLIDDTPYYDGGPCVGYALGTDCCEAPEGYPWILPGLGDGISCPGYGDTFPGLDIGIIDSSKWDDDRFIHGVDLLDDTIAEDVTIEANDDLLTWIETLTTWDVNQDGVIDKNECVIEGTIILTQRGDVAVEDLKEDDLLYAPNFTDGSYGYFKLKHKKASTTQRIVQIVTTGGAELFCSVSHNIYHDSAPENKMPVSKLRPGAPIYILSDEHILHKDTVAKIRLIHSPGVTVYDLDVEEPIDIYFSNAILSHNKTIDPGHEGGPELPGGEDGPAAGGAGVDVVVGTGSEDGD